jgi:Undecaprenyl-phosphate glucose phosphotransferase
LIRRLWLYEFCFRFCCFLLPPFTFLITSTGLRVFALIQPLGRDYVYLYITLSLVWVVCCEHFRVTDVEGLFLGANGVQGCLKSLAWTFMSGFSALFFYRSASYSRLLMGVSAITLLGGVLLLRFVFGSLVKHSGRNRERLRIVVVGTDPFAQMTSRRLWDSVVAPCETVAFVRLPGQTHLVAEGIPVFDLEQLVDRSVNNFADDIVIAVSQESLPILSDLVRQLRQVAIPIRLLMDFGPELEVRERVFRIGETHMLDVHFAPSETISYIVLKRCFDIAFSILVLAVVGVPMAVVALAVKLTSPGPVFFSQERVSINGQRFRMLKYRTMRESPASESDTRWTTPGDSRRTPIGTFLRKTSLDELPQFFNVLVGDMSVVGPRPERPHFVEKFSSEFYAYNVRHHLKSGITGWAQVNGLRGDTDISKRVELDIYYVQNWSFILDLRIIAMTMFSGIVAKNAY